jgi:peptide deformylase
MVMMQMSQSDMMQQIAQLQEGLNQVIHELTETKKIQSIQQKLIKDMADTMIKQYGATCK